MPDDTPVVNHATKSARTDGLFIKLEVGWVDHPKIMRAGIDGAGLHATAMCIAKRLATDGWIDRLLLIRYGASDELIDHLVSLQLLEADGGMVRPWNWLARNPSQDAIDAIRATKREAAARGNHKRWEHEGDFESCARCGQIPTSSHGAKRVRSGCDPTRSPESESESESDIPPPVSGLLATPLPGPRPEGNIEQAVNKAVGLVARHRARHGDDPGALAAAIGRDLPEVDRAELRRLIAEGTSPEDAAASVADPLWVVTKGNHATGADPLARPSLPEFRGYEFEPPVDPRRYLAAIRGEIDGGAS